MREGWKSAKLGEVSAMIKRGIAPKYIDSGGVCVINQKCVRDHSINYDLARRHDIDAKKVPQDRFIQLGDVLVNSTGTGTLGRVAQVRSDPDEPATVDTHVTIVRPADGAFYHDFFGYMLIKIEDEIIKSGEGASGQTELARSKLENQFVVSFPQSIAEQKRIVAILDEAFVGIDTVVANTEKNLANARELLDSTSLKLFEAVGDRQKFTLHKLMELGWITGHLDGNHGSDYPRKSEFVSEGVPYISANCIKSEAVDFSLAKYLSHDRASGLRKGVARNRDVLFAHNATVGPVAMLYTDLDKVVLSTSLTYYRCDPALILPEYLANYMRTPFFKRQYEGVMAQSTRNQVPITKQREFYHLIPSLEEQNAIAGNLDALREDVEQLTRTYRQKLTALAELKQSLLQKAFSGELTAERAEAAVEEATA